MDLRNTTDDANALTIRVIERISHPNYTYPMKYNDVGLLKLKDAAPFNHFIKPACLHRTFEIKPTRAQVVGWGFSGPGESFIYSNSMAYETRRFNPASARALQ